MSSRDTLPWPTISRAAAPFVVVGLGLVIVGGLVSAIAAPTASYHSSWAVAYIVLVAGTAQVLLGLGQAVLTDGTTAARGRLAQLWCWNIGNALVVIGTLFDVPAVLYLGSAALVATLALLLRSVAHVPSGWVLWIVRIITAVLLISIPTGIVIQAVTH